MKLWTKHCLSKNSNTKISVANFITPNEPSQGTLEFVYFLYHAFILFSMMYRIFFILQFTSPFEGRGDRMHLAVLYIIMFVIGMSAAHFSNWLAKKGSISNNLGT